MHAYGLIIGLATIIGIEYFSRHQKIIPKKSENIFITGFLVSALIGARLYHVFDQWSYYSQHFFQIPATWNGGLGIFGALLGALIFIFIFSLIYHLSFISLLDTVTPILPLCQSIGRLGNFINHEIPTWWLEACLDLVLFFLLKKSKTPTAHYLIGYGLIRFLLEFLRTDTWTIGQFKIAQFLSLIFVFFGVILIVHGKNNQIPQNHS